MTGMETLTKHSKFPIYFLLYLKAVEIRNYITNRYISNSKQVKMMILLRFLSISFLVSFISATVVLEKVDVKIIDPSAGRCTIKVNPGPPKTVDIDVESFIEANDMTVSCNLIKWLRCINHKQCFITIQIRFGAFAIVDGHFNEILSSDSVTLCEMPKSENLLVAFVYKELSKAGNLTNACPIKKTSLYIHGFRIEEEDLPIPLPPGDFKVQLNGTLHADGKDIPVFHSETYFKEI